MTPLTWAVVAAIVVLALLGWALLAMSGDCAQHEEDAWGDEARRS